MDEFAVYCNIISKLYKQVHTMNPKERAQLNYAIRFLDPLVYKLYHPELFSDQWWKEFNEQYEVLKNSIKSASEL